jgi:membrane protease YdiL (CAAX protease family)
MRAVFLQILSALLWFVAVLALVLVAVVLGAHVFHIPLRSPALLKLGNDLAADIFLLLLCFGRLPGARQRRGQPAVLGPWTGVRVIAGFALVISAGVLALMNLLFFEQLFLHAVHSPRRVDFGASSALICGALAGELLAALWLAWFLRGLGPAALSDGSPAGIAWRPAAREAYVTAALAAAVIILFVSVLYHFAPPDLKSLQDLPDAKMFEHPGALAVPLLVLFIVFGPVLEEFVFRGVAFAGLASRLGAVWATLISTALFVALHAPEKIHYPPGFIDVGAMALVACWLRLRFGSIRPGILLHILYNGGLMLSAGLMQ